MTKQEAITIIHKFIKQATAEQLRDLICAMYPRCSNECPLRQLSSCECEKITEEVDKIK